MIGFIKAWLMEVGHVQPGDVQMCVLQIKQDLQCSEYHHACIQYAAADIGGKGNIRMVRTEPDVAFLAEVAVYAGAGYPRLIDAIKGVFNQRQSTAQRRQRKPIDNSRDTVQGGE